MRHRLKGRKLGRTTAHRQALERNIVQSLFIYGRIITTDSKAKEFRGTAEHLITLGKVGDLAARRRILRSEEHTSELQSRRDLVCRLLLEQKKTSRSKPASSRHIARRLCC